MTPDSYTIKEEMLAVSDGHQLYIHDWGNKDAKAIFLFLHGGPGSGCSDSHKAYFDGQRDRVVFFDQRGAGKSTPGGSLEANTTQRLVEDIDVILRSRGIDKVILVGGSWGSTLALSYTLVHPEHVQALVLRGIFTGTQAEIDYLDKGQFRNFYPEVWEDFIARTPAAHHSNPAGYHGPRATGTDPTAVTESAYAYSMLEGSIISLDDRHKPDDPATFNPNGTRIEVHYMQNRCFMEGNYILENAHKLTMPTWLVQGRYDMVCPPVTAYELHKKLPNSRLLFTIAGHSGSDRDTFDALRSIISTFNQI